MIWILELSFGSNVVAYLAHRLNLHLDCPYLKKLTDLTFLNSQVHKKCTYMVLREEN